MAAFNKYNIFVADIANGQHNLGTGTLKIALVNTAPAAADTAFAGEVANGNGYTTGGNSPTGVTSTQTGGVYKLVSSGDPATWTCATAPMGPFRYAVLYNTTAAATHQLIGWWDYSSAVTLQIGETFTVDLDNVGGMLTVT